MGPTSVDISPPGDWWVCVTLWMELDVREFVVWGSNGDMASLCRATIECFSVGKGIGGFCGDKDGL